MPPNFENNARQTQNILAFKLVPVKYPNKFEMNWFKGSGDNHAYKVSCQLLQMLTLVLMGSGRRQYVPLYLLLVVGGHKVLFRICKQCPTKLYNYTFKILSSWQDYNFLSPCLSERGLVLPCRQDRFRSMQSDQNPQYFAIQFVNLLVKST